MPNDQFAFGAGWDGNGTLIGLLQHICLLFTKQMHTFHKNVNGKFSWTASEKGRVVLRTLQLRDAFFFILLAFLSMIIMSSCQCLWNVCICFVPWNKHQLLIVCPFSHCDCRDTVTVLKVKIMGHWEQYYTVKSVLHAVGFTRVPVIENRLKSAWVIPVSRSFDWTLQIYRYRSSFL